MIKTFFKHDVRTIIKDFDTTTFGLDRQSAETVYEEITNVSPTLLFVHGCTAGAGETLALYSLSKHLRNNAKELKIEKDILSFDFMSLELYNDEVTRGYRQDSTPFLFSGATAKKREHSKNLTNDLTGEFKSLAHDKTIITCFPYESIPKRSLVNDNKNAFAGLLEVLLQDAEFINVLVRKFKAFKKAIRKRYINTRHGGIIEKLYKSVFLHLFILNEYIDLTHNIRKEVESFIIVIDSITQSFMTTFPFNYAKQPKRTSFLLKAT